MYFRLIRYISSFEVCPKVLRIEADVNVKVFFTAIYSQGDITGSNMFKIAIIRNSHSFVKEPN